MACISKYICIHLCLLFAHRLPSHRLAATLLVLLVLVGIACRSAGAFSLGRLFPASRRGVRGTLLNRSSAQKTTSNVLKEAVKQVATKATPTKLKVRPSTDKRTFRIRSCVHVGYSTTFRKIHSLDLSFLNIKLQPKKKKNIK